MKIIFILTTFILYSCGNEIGTSTSLVEESQTNSQITLTQLNNSYQYSDGSFARNCKDYLENSAYNSEGSAFYTIDPNNSGSALKVYCDMETDGGGWTRIFFHNTADGTFTNKTEARNHNENSPEATDRYSILNRVDSLRTQSNFEFYLRWPSADTGCGSQPHHWEQISDPTTTSESVIGYSAISGGTTQPRADKGLCLSSSGSTLLDGNCGHSNWWYAVGTVNMYSGGLPACLGVETSVELLIR